MGASFSCGCCSCVCSIGGASELQHSQVQEGSTWAGWSWGASRDRRDHSQQAADPNSRAHQQSCHSELLYVFQTGSSGLSTLMFTSPQLSACLSGSGCLSAGRWLKPSCLPDVMMHVMRSPDWCVDFCVFVWRVCAASSTKAGVQRWWRESGARFAFWVKTQLVFVPQHLETGTAASSSCQALNSGCRHYSKWVFNRLWVCCFYSNQYSLLSLELSQ